MNEHEEDALSENAQIVHDAFYLQDPDLCPSICLATALRKLATLDLTNAEIVSIADELEET